MSRPSSDMAEFKKVLASSKHVIIMTGAGVSAESGVPTFRGAGGYWRKWQAQDLATPEAFWENPSLVWEFYHYRREVMLSKNPNPAHHAIAKCESILKSQGKELVVITQNIDGLHKRAGSDNIIELHGNLFKTRCTKCKEVKINTDSPICEALRGKGAPEPGTHAAAIDKKDLPKCKNPECGGLLRPHVVWFGEQLESHVLERTDQEMEKCDLCLVVGTSSVVYPAAGYAPMLAARGVPVAEFNMEETPVTQQLGHQSLDPNTERPSSETTADKKAEEKPRTAMTCSDVLSEFAETTTAHAPPKILSAKKIVVKLFWLLIFLGGVGAFVYYAQSLIRTYLDYDTTTSIQLRFDVLEFPAVTVCNQNQFRMDLLPDDLSELFEDFLTAKRKEMFGGEGHWEEFKRRGELAADEYEYDQSSFDSTESIEIVSALSSPGDSSSTFPEQIEEQAAASSAGPTAASTAGPAAAQGPAAAPTAGLAAAQGPTAASTAGSAAAQGPTAAPTAGSAAAQGPTAASTAGSAAAQGPTAAPTTGPTAAPTAGPTAAPTAGPTAAPTAGPTAAPTAGSAAASSAGQTPTTPAAGPAGGPSGRRKRSAIELSDQEMEPMIAMYGFYLEPTVDLNNKTWFDSAGQESSNRDIMLNVTSYLANMSIAEKMAAGHAIDEMLQECTFAGMQCGPRDFYQFFDMTYGNCYTFNSGMNGQIAKISSPGASFGLSLTMFINQAQYVPVMSSQAGLRVLLHRQGQIPIMNEDGFDLAPGTNNGVAVKYVEVQRAGGLYSNCTDGNDPNSYYEGNYTQKGCLKTCLQNAIISECGCKNSLYRGPEDVRPCLPDEFACVDIVELRILENDKNCLCPTPCWESQYSFVISSSQWPSNAYMPYMAESLEERGSDMKSVLSDRKGGLSENFVKFSIYYDNLNYQKYTESPSLSFEDLVGSLGGHLGLWIGMSIVSFFEVFELILHFIAHCHRKLHGDNKTGSLTELDDRYQRAVVTPVQKMKMPKDSGWGE